MRGTRWLIFLPSVVLAFFSTVTNAEPVQGLNATGYIVTDIPPTKSDAVYEICGSELENNINRSFDGEPFQDCPDDMFMIHYTGSIIIPAHDTIQFWLASDDGGTIKIGMDEFGSWGDQGCSATESGFLDLDTGIQSLDGWFYENSGGTCWMLAWQIDDEPWQIVPEEAFTTNGDVSTTTVAVTTTVESTTTSSVQTSTSLAPEPTMPEQSTTTTSTTTSLVIETTTTTEPVSPPVAQPPVLVQPEPIELPTIQDMEPIPVVIEPVEEALPYETPDTYPTVEIPDTLPFVGVDEPDFVDDLPDFDLPVIDEPVIDIIIPETLPDAPEAPLSDEELETILDTIETVEALTEALEELTPEQAEQLIEAILEEEPTQEQATAIASSPAALAVLTSDQATQVFEALDVTELDNTQLEALAEAVSDAPTEVKEAFEDSVDIFSDGLGTYVPVDSKIPVSERVTLIAIAAGATLTAASSRMRR